MLIPLYIAAQAWLARADSAVGITSARGAVLRLAGSNAKYFTDESDRWYAPFVIYPSADTVWVDPATGVERAVASQTLFIRSARATFADGAVASARAHAAAWIRRAFDPWAVLAEWRGDTAVRIAGRRLYRDYSRVALTRPGRYGVDTLLLDERTAIPVALARTETHYFLGPIHVVYDYQTWFDVGRGALYPMSTTRLIDGESAESRFVNLYTGGGALVPADSAPAIVVPDTAVRLAIDPHDLFAADPLDTIAVGPGTYLLVNHGFTSVVSLQRDTIFILDTPSGQERARLEHERVAQLFPGQHPYVLVAMNAVWPHIAGMRYWVSQGAAVVASRPVVPYLHSVLDRRWTALPDDFERARARLRPRIESVGDTALRAGGAIRLYPMDGINGETVLLAYIAPARFVWATDHIQIVNAHNILVDDVLKTAAHHALAPLLTSGPHFRAIPWDSLPR
jgi:hypothetical protein